MRCRCRRRRHRRNRYRLVIAVVFEAEAEGKARGGKRVGRWRERCFFRRAGRRDGRQEEPDERLPVFLSQMSFLTLEAERTWTTERSVENSLTGSWTDLRGETSVT